jgi:DNA/RNA endonuclease G (NUC1)
VAAIENNLFSVANNNHQNKVIFGGPYFDGQKSAENIIIFSGKK